MYRQTTSRTLLEGDANGAKTRSVAYNSLLAGWKDYLAHYNQGRPIIFIGHSQGSAMLMLLLSRQVDSNPKILRRMVSAILPGGNVEVPTVAGGGGTFRHIPACRWKGQTGCVIAYSTYPGQPPANSLFARPNKGISAGLKGQAPKTSQVLCVNPAALGGGSARLDSYSIRRAAVTMGIPYFTTMAAASALAEAIRSVHQREMVIRSLQEYHAAI